MGLLILESPKKKKKSKRKIISPEIHHHGIYTHTHPLRVVSFYFLYHTADLIPGASSGLRSAQGAHEYVL
jgi:hypothetical protein